MKPEKSSVPFVIITCTNSEEQAIQLLTLGASDYLFVDRLARLPFAICNAIEKSDLEKQQQEIQNAGKGKEDTDHGSVLKKDYHLYKSFFSNAPAWMGYFKGPDFIFERANRAFLNSTTKKNIIGKKLCDVYPEFKEQGLLRMLNNAYNTGEGFELKEAKFTVLSNGVSKDFYINLSYLPNKDPEGNVEGFFFYASVVTSHVVARKNAEESEKKYRYIVETAQEGIWIIDENNKTVFVNQKLSDLFEYSIAEMIGRTNYSFKDESYLESLQRAEMRKKGANETHESKFFTKSGKQIWTIVSTTPVFSDDGQYKGALAMITDITGRKEWETTLIEKKEQLQKAISQQEAILDALPPHIALLDKNGTILSVNESWKKFGRENGVENETVWIGQNYIEVSERSTGEGADYGRDIAKSIRDVISGKADFFSMEYPCDTKLEKKWFRAVISPLINRVDEGAVVLHIDVTERRQAEEQLQEKQEQLLASQRIAHVGSWHRNIDNPANIKDKPVLCSEEALRIMGLDPGLSYISFEQFMEIIHPGDLECVAAVNEKAFSNFTYYKIDHRIVLRDGTVKWVHRDARFIKDKDTGKPVKMIGTIQDITEQKLREFELKKNYEEREILIRELTSSNKDLKQFTYITSHNFKAPLSNLIGLLGLFDYSTLSDSNREVVEMFKGATNMLNKTINDLIQILIIKNNVSVSIVKINMKALFNEAISSLAIEIKDAGCTISKNFAVKNIFFNKSYLESILINLLSNAIKYRSHKRPLQIEVATEQSSRGKTVLTVRDNGMGIDLERHGNKIFGLYQRFHNNSDGVGLGLFIVRSQVTALGGNIEVESKLNKGSVFKVTFNN